MTSIEVIFIIFAAICTVQINSQEVGERRNAAGYIPSINGETNNAVNYNEISVQLGLNNRDDNGSATRRIVIPPLGFSI